MWTKGVMLHVWLLNSLNHTFLLIQHKQVSPDSLVQYFTQPSLSNPHIWPLLPRSFLLLSRPPHSPPSCRWVCSGPWWRPCTLVVPCKGRRAGRCQTQVGGRRRKRSKMNKCEGAGKKVRSDLMYLPRAPQVHNYAGKWKENIERGCFHREHNCEASFKQQQHFSLDLSGNY